MKNCVKCGAQLSDGAGFCQYCGASQAVNNQNSGQYQNSQYQDPNGYQAAAGGNSYQNTNGGYPQQDNQIYNPPVQSAPNTKGLEVTSIVLGAVGLVLAWVVALFGYACGGVGLGLSIAARKKNPQRKVAIVGMILSIVTLAFSLINSALGIVMYIEHFMSY